MKYVKTFENKNDIIWAVVSISNLTPSDYSIYLFEDKNSAENFYIELVNGIAKDNYYDNNFGSDDKYSGNLIFTVEEAEKYVSENDIMVEYKSYTISGKYELPEELKIGRDSKKYNL